MSKTREEKVEILKGLVGEKLWSAYVTYSYKFNPCDDESCENLDLCKEEIARRLAVADKAEGRV